MNMPRYTFIKSIVSRKKIKFCIWDEETGNPVRETTVTIEDPEIVKALMREFKQEEAKLNSK